MAITAAATKSLRSKDLRSAARAQSMEPQLTPGEVDLVTAFLTTNNFKRGPAGHKRWLLSTQYPLHAAVEATNVEVIRLLLRLRVDQQVQDSQGHTPLEIAEALNRDGSHDAVLQEFGRKCKKIIEKDSGRNGADSANFVWSPNVRAVGVVGAVGLAPFLQC